MKGPSTRSKTSSKPARFASWAFPRFCRILLDHIRMGVFDVFQIPYSALQPEHEAAIAEAARGGAGIVIRGGVARGEPGAGHGLADVWKVWEQAQLDELLEDMSATEFMLRFTMTSPDMHTTIVGTLNPAHLQENVTAVMQGPLPAAMYDEAKRRLAAARAVPGHSREARAPGSAQGP